MARVKTEGFADVIKDLSSFNVDKLTDEMVKAAEPIMVEALQNRARKHNRTGSMASSIKSTGVKKLSSGDGKYLVVRPTGRDSKGVRNMEKMAYLEYGTFKQSATPVVAPAVNDCQSKVEQSMQNIFDKYTEKVSVE